MGWDDHVKVYRDVNTRLKVICISQFPRNCIRPEEFVERPKGVLTRADMVELKEKTMLEEHPVLVAHPARVREDDDEQCSVEPEREVGDKHKKGGNRRTVALGTLGLVK